MPKTWYKLTRPPRTKTGVGPAVLASPTPVDGLCALGHSRARRIRATAPPGRDVSYSSLAA